MRRRYRVTYDCEKEPAFFIHMNDKVVKFPERNDGLYALYMENDNKNNEEKSMVISTKEMSQLYTNRQIMRAGRARDLYHLLGAPSVQDLKAIITQNLI